MGKQHSACHGRIRSFSFIKISVLWVEDVFCRFFVRLKSKWSVAWLALFQLAYATEKKIYLKKWEWPRGQGTYPNEWLPKLAFNSRGWGSALQFSLWASSSVASANRLTCTEWSLGINCWMLLFTLLKLSKTLRLRPSNICYAMRNDIISFTFQRHRL